MSAVWASVVITRVILYLYTMYWMTVARASHTYAEKPLLATWEIVMTNTVFNYHSIAFFYILRSLQYCLIDGVLPIMVRYAQRERKSRPFGPAEYRSELFQDCP